MTPSTTDQPNHRESGAPDAPLDSAKAPAANGLLPVIGVVCALLVVALGVVGVREALVHAGALSGGLWIDAAVGDLDTRAPADWMIPAGVLAALVGLILVLLGLRPRRRKESAVTSHTGIFLTTRSIQRLAKAAAAHVDGVDTTSVKAKRTRVKVDATTLTSDTSQTAARIEEAVTRRLSGLSKPPKVKVQVGRAGGSS